MNRKLPLELAYDAYGDSGAPLVILHGLLGSARNWSGIGKRLGESSRVFALDLRNHGRSPWADQMTFDAMADDVAGFILRHDLNHAGVIGHSLGGKVAMRLALTRPALVARLVVVDIAPVAYRHSFANYVEALRRVDLSAVTRRADADEALQEAIPEPGIRSFLMQNLVQRDDGFAWRLNLAALAGSMDQLMDFPAAPATAYRRPALFLAGGRSDYVLSEHRPLIAKLFPAAAHAVIEEAGHWVHAERPAEFLAELRAFLATP
jgi:pimeloyl-ACP methyl ester carboxylesterase